MNGATIDALARSATVVVDLSLPAAVPARLAEILDRRLITTEAELAALWRRFPDSEPEASEAIEAMTRHLANRLLREPLERLGRDTDGRNEQAVRDIFAL